MTQALVHRGPDGRRSHSDERVALGHARLTVIDPETGDQPIWNETRDVVTVVNGEIYNYQELRSELEAKGHVFATASDCEHLLVPQILAPSLELFR